MQSQDVKKQLKISNLWLFSFVFILTLSVTISFIFLFEINFFIACFIIVFMIPILWWKQILLYKLIENMNIHFLYFDPKKNELKKYENLDILERLKFLKNPFLHDIVLKDLAYLNNEINTCKKLDHIINKLYLRIDEKEYKIDFTNSDTLIKFLITNYKTFEGSINDEFISLVYEQKTLENYLEQNKIDFFNIKSEIALLDLLCKYGKKFQIEIHNLESRELEIYKRLSNYYQTEKTLILDIIIIFYIILFEIMFFFLCMYSKEKDTENNISNKYLSSGLHINFSNIVQKIGYIKTAIETEMIIKYSSKAQTKAQLCYNKSFGELTLSKKILTLTSIPNFTNPTLVVVQNELAQKLDKLALDRVMLHNEIIALEMKAEKNKIIKSKIVELQKVDLMIKHVTNQININGYTIPLPISVRKNI